MILTEKSKIYLGEKTVYSINSDGKLEFHHGDKKKETGVLFLILHKTEFQIGQGPQK